MSMCYIQQLGPEQEGAIFPCFSLSLRFDLSFSLMRCFSVSCFCFLSLSVFVWLPLFLFFTLPAMTAVGGLIPRCSAAPSLRVSEEAI